MATARRYRANRLGARATALAAAGIADLSATFLDRVTPSYTALLDRHGELIAGFADMEQHPLNADAAHSGLRIITRKICCN